MASKTTETIETTENPVITQEKATGQSLVKFTLERLRRDCLKLFGVSTSTFDGAFFGLAGTFTLDETKNIIQKFKNKSIKIHKKGGK